MIQLINYEQFTNIQRAQAGLTRLFRSAAKRGSFYRVLKNDEPLGVLVPNQLWEDIVEDIEAMSSPAYKARIAKARSEKKRIPAEKIRKMVGL